MYEHRRRSEGSAEIEIAGAAGLPSGIVPAIIVGLLVTVPAAVGPQVARRRV